LHPNAFSFGNNFALQREKNPRAPGTYKGFLFGKKGKVTTFEEKKRLKSPYLDNRFSEFPKNIAGFQNKIYCVL
jgi:hypothetical protein